MGTDPLPLRGYASDWREVDWEAVATVDTSGLRGNEVHFVALRDGTLVVHEDEPDGSVAPLADAVEHTIDRPYRALGERQDGDLWSVGAQGVDTVELPADFVGESIEVTSIGGTREVRVDGEPATLDLPELDRPGDYALTAGRLTETTWVVDVGLL